MQKEEKETASGGEDLEGILVVSLPAPFNSLPPLASLMFKQNVNIWQGVFQVLNPVPSRV